MSDPLWPEISIPARRHDGPFYASPVFTVEARRRAGREPDQLPDHQPAQDRVDECDRNTRSCAGVLPEALVSSAMILLAAEHGPWALGWEALVAVGTLLLAGYTARLAFFTRRSVEAARDEQSATWRPVVLPLALRTRVRDLPEEGLTLDVFIGNRGSGPAFDVTACIRENGQVTWPIAGGQMTGADGHGILQVDEELRARFAISRTSDEGAELTIAYLDLGGRSLWTTARLSWAAGYDYPIEVVAPRLGYGSSR